MAFPDLPPTIALSVTRFCNESRFQTFCLIEGLSRARRTYLHQILHLVKVLGRPVSSLLQAVTILT